jgi:YggT family protein
MPNPIFGMISFIIELALNMAQVIVIASVIISWVGADPYNPLVQLIRNITEPMYRPFRKLTQSFSGPIDLSPLIILLIITTIQKGFLPYLKMMLLQPS